MAALTSTIVAGAGVALSAYQAYQGAQQQEDANKSAADIAAKQKILAESNKVSGLQVPQLGYKLAQESQAQRSASQLQALQGAGVAGVLGGVPALNQAAAAEDLQLAASLDAQKAERDQFVAAQEQASEARRVQQQSDMLNNQMAGAQNARAMGQATEQAGYAGMLESAGTAANAYMQSKSLYEGDGSNEPSLISKKDKGKYSMEEISGKKLETTQVQPDIASGLGIKLRSGKLDKLRQGITGIADQDIIQGLNIKLPYLQQRQ